MLAESHEDYSVPAMAYVLQSRTSTVGERIAALRSLKQHLEENKSIDSYNQKRIKQLILDNVLQMILSEERVTNIVKRQLVRTELFLILAKLLDSNALFGSVLAHDNSSVESHAESVHEYNSEIDTLNSLNSHHRMPPPRHGHAPSGALRTRSSLGRRIMQPPGGWVNNQGSQVSQMTQFSSSQGLSHVHSPVSPLRHSSSTGRLHEVGFIDPQSPTHNNNFHDNSSVSTFSRGESRGRSRGTSRGTSRVGPDFTLLKPLLQKATRSQQAPTFSNKAFSAKMLKPRPSVLHNELVADNFVPGADPTNYFEQDKKLGYQKPRMWFPGGNTTTAHDLLPTTRTTVAPSVSAAEQVVQEFLQMRSLASYVGDLVAPYVPAIAKESYMTIKNGAREGTPGSPGGHTTRLTGLTDQARFHATLREIANVWTPLLGLHIPPPHLQAELPGTTGSRKRKLSAFSSAGVGGVGNGSVGSVSTMHSIHTPNTHASPHMPTRTHTPHTTTHTIHNTDQYAEYAQEIVPFKCLRVSDNHTHTHRAHTRKHSIQEYEQQRQEAELLGKTMRPLPEHTTTATAKQYQTDVTAYLTTQKAHILASVRASERLIQATIRSNYHLFKPKYLLLLEGNKADARATLASAMVVFCRVKRCNLLSVAWGVWKILLVQMASVARRPLYARVAACYLMSRWQQEVHLKKLRIWIVRWRRRTAALIFMQRSLHVTRIQTLYRTWRDRRKFIAMHHSKTYMGVLSDVYLGPRRKGLAYYIPDVIRSDRRLLWLAATIIQTIYRCYIASKQYYHKRRMIVLIQSLIRMFPIYRKFRRLKKTTIKCQAWMRRTVKQVQYKRLKAATIVVQKYVRRYLCTIHKLRTFEHMWHENEQPLAAVIMIQCRYRIRLAKKRIKSKKFAIAMRTYSALVIQRSYYRYKKAFHTFFLMCVLRVRESEDIKAIKRKNALLRHKAAVVIQTIYKYRYFKRNISAIVRVQCWFRGRMGYGLVDILRKERWASRKLRAWAKVKVNRRRKMARRIQRWWWSRKEGRLRAHLWYRFRLLDAEHSLQRSETRHFAAMRIQAIVKGVWDRRWVKRHRAVLIIQRNARFYFALRRWRRWKKERIMKIVRKYALYAQEKGLKNVTARILRKHSDNMKRPQALGRGFIVRNIMRHAKWVAYRMGLAAVRIQRCWRNSHILGKALEVVRALKREKANPFVPCSSAHEVLLMMRQQTKTLYSTYDPRVGMRVSSLMYRLGCLELLDMFPRKHYNTVHDLHTLNTYKLTDLYDAFRARPADAKKGSNSSVKVKKRVAPPTQLFETLLSIVTPPLYSPLPAHRAKYVTLQALPEYEVPHHASEGFKKTFQKKFGKNLNARADHMSHTLLGMIWGEYNNYKSVGLVLTKHQILKAISTAGDSNHPLSELVTIRTRENGVVDERKYDKERIGKTHTILQLAVDRMLPLLPQGKLRAMLERAVNRIVTYKRKMQFVRHKLVSGHGHGHVHPTTGTTATAGGAASNTHTTPHATTTNTHTTPHNTTATPATTTTPAATTSDEEQRGALDFTSPGFLHTVLPIPRTLDLPFTSTVADLDLEVDISVCRVYFDVLDKLYMLTRAVQSLKNSWHNSSTRRAVAARKTAELKKSIKTNYLSDRHTDKVKLTWLKHKRIETSKKKLELIMKSVRTKRAMCTFALSFVPRYGWENAYDENGYLYWYDTKTRHTEESTYDMPLYTLQQYYSVAKLQRVARGYNVKQYERKLVREAEARAEVERIAIQMEIERKKGMRVVKSVYSLYDRVITPTTTHTHTTTTPKHSTTHHTHTTHTRTTTTPTIEQLLPWRFRFEENPVFRSGHWALFKINNTTHSGTSGASGGSGGNNVHTTHTPHYLQSIHHTEHEHNTHNTNTATHLAHANTTHTEPLHKQYEIVVIFRLKADEQVCDVRNTKGKTLRNIPLKRLFQMNLDVHMAVETRYKQERVFYNSTITHIDTTTDAEFMYSIRYDDGETATTLKRDAIRPTLQTLRTFLNGRESALKLAHVQHKRMQHYAMLKKQRISTYNTKHSNSGGGMGSTSNDNVLLLHDGSVSRPDSPVLLIENNTALLNSASGEGVGFSRSDSEHMLMIENSTNESANGTNESANNSAKYSTTSTALVTVPSESDLLHNNNTSGVGGGASGKHTLVRGSSVSNNIHDTTVVLAEPIHRIDIKVKLYYSRVCNRYGWNTYTDNTNTSGVKYYVNQFTEQIVDSQPVYEAIEVQSATRIQHAYLVYKAKCVVYRTVLHCDVVNMVHSTIRRCVKIAYVGFELEGVTAMQMLRRAGYWELSELLETYYRATRQSLQTLSIESISKIPKESYESHGIVQPMHQKEMREFQAWYSKTSVLDKQKRLSLFNYFKGWDDKRDIGACIRGSEEVYVAKFMKFVKTGGARTRLAVQGILEASLFPHTHQQVDTYLKKYEGKAELTREMVFELINKPTTHTYLEERVVLRHYTNTARVVCAVLHALRLKHLRGVVIKALKQCEEIMRGVVVVPGQARPLCTGPEAKAALLLRRNVFQFLLRYIAAAETVQRNVRAYLLSKQWNIYLVARMRGVAVLQRTMRRTLAYRVRKMLQMQRESDWEQLWDSRRNYLYYYNYATGASQYNEPDVPFRPLVRDPLSAALIQAWPDLDNRNGVVALLPTTQGNTSVVVQHSHTMCGICNVRKCVRICNDCTDEVYWDSTKYHCFPYCFTCYMKEHVEDNAERAKHTFVIVEEAERQNDNNNNSVVVYNGENNANNTTQQVVLQCCMCDQPATRKCIGLLDDESIEKICNKLHHTAPEGWIEILKQANIAGDRKLTLLLDQIRSESATVVSAVVAFQSTEANTNATNNKTSPTRVKTPNKKKAVKAEPEESPEPPSPTTKTLCIHHLQAIRALLENSRAECDECYCSTCYEEVHSGGKRALHKWKGFRARAVVCSVCTNAPAELNCLDCDSQYCTSCYKVFHSMGRKRNHKREKVLEVLEEREVFCGVCERRAADTPCDNDRCHFSGCDSCMWFKHLPSCTRDATMMGGTSPSSRRRAPLDERPLSPDGGNSRIVQSNKADVDEDACVVCGELADTRCVQCKDCYCSRVWMGNAGCFAQHHSKGNRTAHTTELYIGRKELMAQMKRSKSMRASKKGLGMGVGVGSPGGNNHK